MTGESTSRMTNRRGNMSDRLLLAFIILMTYMLFTMPLQHAEAQQEHLRIHNDAVVVDGHNDILSRVARGDRIDIRSTRGQSDLPRFREAGLNVQLFSVYVHPRHGVENGWRAALQQMDSLHAIAGRYPDRLRVVTNMDELRRSIDADALAGILALEGALILDTKHERIRELHQRGLRVLAPTWNVSTGWASSSNDESAQRGFKGLTGHGRSIIRLLDSLGILIDVSHIGERAFYDILNTTRNPIIASHSSCAALRKHHRNLTDEQLRALARNGGVAMINFYPNYLRSDFGRSNIALLRQYCARVDKLLDKHRQHSDELLQSFDAIVLEARSKRLPTLLDVADHIEHAISIAGTAHVGLGSDFDGIPYGPVGLHDVRLLPMLTRELLRRGYRPDTVKGILGGNFLRVFKATTRNGK